MPARSHRPTPLQANPSGGGIDLTQRIATSSGWRLSQLVERRKPGGFGLQAPTGERRSKLADWRSGRLALRGPTAFSCRGLPQDATLSRAAMTLFNALLPIFIKNLVRLRPPPGRYRAVLGIKGWPTTFTHEDEEKPS
jgi:hypothetical protein